MASFEGKPLTDEHPNDWVRPDNAASYVKGVIHNVRQGQGEDQDKLIADLIVYDPVLISEIENGKREISCGYECTYEEITQGYQQSAISGNHVAVVRNGRAGESVAIKDEKPERSNKMTKKTLAQKLLASFIKDAEPEEIQDAAEFLAGNAGQEENKAQQDADPLEEIKGALQALAAKIDALGAGQAGDGPLEQLEKDLAENEESVTISPEEVTDGEEEITEDEEEMIIEDEEGPVMPEEERPVNPIPNADSARRAARTLLRQMKPVIAEMKNGPEKQQMTDALIKAVNKLVAPTGGARGRNTLKGANGYADILAARRKTLAKDKKPYDTRQLGKDIAAKYNPHYKKEGK
jgi:hypothetical protein